MSQGNTSFETKIKNKIAAAMKADPIWDFLMGSDDLLRITNSIYANLGIEERTWLIDCQSDEDDTWDGFTLFTDPETPNAYPVFRIREVE